MHGFITTHNILATNFIKAYVARNICIHDLICNDTSLFTLVIFVKRLSCYPATLFSSILLTLFSGILPAVCR